MLMCGVAAKSVAHLMKFHLLQWEVVKVALSRMVKEIEANLYFSIFGENSNGRHFWGEESFLKIPNSTFLRYPVDRSF